LALCKLDPSEYRLYFVEIAHSWLEEGQGRGDGVLLLFLFLSNTHRTSLELVLSRRLGSEIIFTLVAGNTRLHSLLDSVF